MRLHILALAGVVPGAASRVFDWVVTLDDALTLRNESGPLFRIGVGFFACTDLCLEVVRILGILGRRMFRNYGWTLCLLSQKQLLRLDVPFEFVFEQNI